MIVGTDDSLNNHVKLKVRYGKIVVCDTLVPDTNVTEMEQYVFVSRSRVMKSKWRVVVGNIMILLVVSLFVPNGIQAKQLKVVEKTKSMKVGQKKTFKASQTVKWKSLNKNLVITTKTKAKKITACAKKRGTGVLIAQKGKRKVTLKVNIKGNTQKKPVKIVQRETIWEEAMKSGRQVYIIDISDNKIKFATEKGGSFSKYLLLDEKIQILKKGESVGKDAFQIGQSVLLTFTNYEKKSGGRIDGCTCITIIEKYWDDVIRESKRSYIISIEGDIVALSVTKGGGKSKYFKLDDTITIMKDGKHVDKSALEVGQCVSVEYSYHEDSVGGRLWEVKSVKIIS